MAWEPDRRSNFFNPPAHLCAVTYITEISLIVTLNNQFTNEGDFLIGPSQISSYFFWRLEMCRCDTDAPAGIAKLEYRTCLELPNTKVHKCKVHI